MKGCRILLSKWTYSRLESPIEIRCGDFVVDTSCANHTRRRLLCPKCQYEVDNK
jgi:ribosomal protein S27AE